MADPARWLDLTAAAAYLPLRPDIFARKVKAGIIPAPSVHLGERTPRWDQGVLDATMGGGTGSTNAREAVNALATQIAAEPEGQFATHSRTAPSRYIGMNSTRQRRHRAHPIAPPS
jgi:hypothetical protein